MKKNTPCPKLTLSGRSDRPA